MYEIRPSVVRGKPVWTVYKNGIKVMPFSSEVLAINYVASVRFVENYEPMPSISNVSVLGVRHGS